MILAWILEEKAEMVELSADLIRKETMQGEECKSNAIFEPGIDGKPENKAMLVKEKRSVARTRCNHVERKIDGSSKFAGCSD